GSKVIIPIVNRVIPIIGEESINMSLDNGIVRITPGHDEFSFQIAPKHKLSTNKFVIDTDGNFTNLAGDFAGKKVSLFIDNIIQNLDDIHNLESVVNFEYDIVVSKKSGEKLYKLLSNQWVINFTDQINDILNDIQEEKINIKPNSFSINIEDSLQKINKIFSFTKQNISGHFLPVWKSKKGNDYLLDENIILSYPKKVRQNKNIIMTLIIFNLIADKRLSNVFYLNELIELLFSKSLGNEDYLLQSYLDFYKEKKISGVTTEIEELAKIISYADKQKGISNFEKFSLSLIKLIEKTFLITKLQNGKYEFEMNFFAKRGDPLIQQETNVVDPGFVNGLLLLYNLGFFDEGGKGNEIKKIFLTPNEKFFSILKILLIGSKTIGKNIFDQLFPQSFIVDKKGKKIGQEESAKLSFYLRQYGADVVRLSLILGDISNALSKTYDYQEISLSELFINKFWNAIRFIFINLLGFDFEEKIKKVNFKSIQDIFKKNEKKINIYDSWILYKLKELQDEAKEQLLSNNILKFSEKLFNFVKNDFCEKYLEILKLNKKIDLEIMLFVVGNMLKLLYPYVPFVAEKLWELIGFKGLLIENPINDFVCNIEKNYKIELFLEIIDKILLMRNNIKIKKHEKINVIFKTNPNFLQFLKSNETIVNRLVNAENIEYLDVGKISADYQVQDVIDVSVGIKAIVVSQKKVENLSYWQEEIIKQNEYLQHLRNFISTLSSSGAGDSVIRSKKAEMMKIKEKIEELEFKISKFKSKDN
ncbi:MAG: class I tRNA ligase family protein, partial [Candidatus Absconditabacterales bacterium]